MLLEDMLNRCHELDAGYWCQIFKENAIEWSGWNAALRRTYLENNKPKTLYMFGPVLDAPPAHPDTVLTTMKHCRDTLLSMGMKWQHMDLDMQLYVQACTRMHTARCF